MVLMGDFPCISTWHMLSFCHRFVDHLPLSSAVCSLDVVDQSYGDDPRITTQKWRLLMASHLTCLVTLHGVGFEHPPQQGVMNSGYADLLHLHLKKCTCLEGKLTDDPGRRPDGSGDHGAIYVESLWKRHGTPPSREEGLKRLGSWDANKDHILTADAPLVPHDAQDGSVAHVALVYSNLEPRGPEIGVSLLTLEEASFSAPRYASLFQLIRMALFDVLAMRPAGRNRQPTSLRPRRDRKHRSIKQPDQQEHVVPDSSPGLFVTLRNLEDDVAAYVCQNSERERVRSFVAEALMRLAYREDVDHIILNTHSNGTVVAFDVLCRLPKKVTDKIHAFVTAGSPLRKYVDLFHWGYEIQSIFSFSNWNNYWDKLDPVADPLNPPFSWKRGERIVPSKETLFGLVDLDNEEKPSWIEVTDCQVNNVKYTQDGGLRAHNYWDNKKQFVPALADLVFQIADKLDESRPAASTLANENQEISE